MEAWAVIVRDKDITSKTFRSENPFANPLLQERIAPLYIAAGAPQDLPPIALRNLISLSLGLTPVFPEGEDITKEDFASLQQAVAGGKGLQGLTPHLVHLFTQTSLFPKNENVEKIAAKLEERASTHPPKIAFEFNVVFTEVGPVRCPVYRALVGRSDEYVDNIARNYPASDEESSLENYTKHNKLPKGTLYFSSRNPLAGVIESIEHRDTPATNMRIEDALSTAASYGCLAAGIVGLVVSGGTLALAAGVVGWAGSGWNAYRGYEALKDRAAHGESNTDREGLLIVADTVTSSVNFGAFGSVAASTAARAAGFIGNESQWANTAIRAIEIGAAATIAVALGASGARFADDYHRMTPAQRRAAGAMLVLSVVMTAKPFVSSHSAATAVAPTEPAPLPPAPPPARGSLDPTLAEMAVNANSKPGANANLGTVKGGGKPRAPYDPTRGRAANDEAAPSNDPHGEVREQVQEQRLAMAANGDGRMTMSTALDPRRMQGAGVPPGPKDPKGPTGPVGRPGSQPTAPNPHRDHPRPGSPRGPRRADLPSLRSPSDPGRPSTPPSPAHNEFAGPEGQAFHDDMSAWLAAHSGSPQEPPSEPATARTRSHAPAAPAQPHTPPPDSTGPFAGPEELAIHTGMSDVQQSIPASQPVREFDPTRRPIFNWTPEERARHGIPAERPPSRWARFREWLTARPPAATPRTPPPPTPQPSDPRHWARIWDRSDFPEIARPPADPELAQTVIQTRPQMTPVVTAIGPRGGISIDSRTFVGVFREVVLRWTPDQAEFIRKVVGTLEQLKSDVRKTITVGDFFEMVHNWGLLEHEDVAAGLDNAMHDLVTVQEFDKLRRHRRGNQSGG